MKNTLILSFYFHPLFLSTRRSCRFDFDPSTYAMYSLGLHVFVLFRGYSNLAWKLIKYEPF